MPSNIGAKLKQWLLKTWPQGKLPSTNAKKFSDSIGYRMHNYSYWLIWIKWTWKYRKVKRSKPSVVPSEMSPALKLSGIWKAVNWISRTVIRGKYITYGPHEYSDFVIRNSYKNRLEKCRVISMVFYEYKSITALLCLHSYYLIIKSVYCLT